MKVHDMPKGMQWVFSLERKWRAFDFKSGTFPSNFRPNSLIFKMKKIILVIPHVLLSNRNKI